MNPDDLDPQAALAGLSDANLSQAKQEARLQFDRLVAHGGVNEENYCEHAEQVVDDIVCESGLQLGNEDFVIVTWNTIFADLLAYAEVSIKGYRKHSG